MHADPDQKRSISAQNYRGRRRNRGENVRARDLQNQKVSRGLRGHRVRLFVFFFFLIRTRLCRVNSSHFSRIKMTPINRVF